MWIAGIRIVSESFLRANTPVASSALAMGNSFTEPNGYSGLPLKD